MKKYKISLRRYIKERGLLTGIKKWRADRTVAKALRMLENFSVFSNFYFSNEVLYTAVLERYAAKPLLIASCTFTGCRPMHGQESDYLTVVPSRPTEGTVLAAIPSSAQATDS